jgi:Pyridoxamine 5'-phosphate oxidase
MPSWNDVTAAAPDLAARAQALFDAHRHKTLATLRRDGSPRISGIEVTFKDGEMWLGMMPGSLKAHDLQRDPRLAVHSASDDPDDEDPQAWPGDAKAAGRAVEVTDEAVLATWADDTPPGPFHLFRIDLTELVATKVGDPADHLVIDVWTATDGLRQVKRA